MTIDPGTLALVSLLLPAASFLVLAIAAPFRRLGRPAAFFSVLCAALAFTAAFLAWQAQGLAGTPTLRVWEWLPGPGKPLATVGVLVDGDSTVMLMLVTLVALLVQVYSLEYLHEEPAKCLGRYYTYQSLFAF